MLPAEDGMIIWYNLHNIMGGIEVESHTRKKKKSHRMSQEGGPSYELMTQVSIADASPPYDPSACGDRSFPAIISRFHHFFWITYLAYWCCLRREDFGLLIQSNPESLIC